MRLFFSVIRNFRKFVCKLFDLCALNLEVHDQCVLSNLKIWLQNLGSRKSLLFHFALQCSKGVK